MDTRATPERTSDALDLHVELAVTQEAAREAGAYLLRQQGHEQIRRQKARFDTLLNVDVDAEQVILRRLRETFPLDGIVSEESDPSNPDAHRQWIVDPLDGSANYWHGVSTYGVMIGLAIDAAPSLAVIYLPPRDELFVAIRGGGAARNGEPIHVSSTPTLSDAMVHLGDFSKSGSWQENTDRLAIIDALANQVGRLRMVGAAATDFTSVACGRADALVMRASHRWDYEGGTLLASEAGGICSTVTSAQGHQFIVASNVELHEPLMKAVQTAFQESSPQ